MFRVDTWYQLKSTAHAAVDKTGSIFSREIKLCFYIRTATTIHAYANCSQQCQRSERSSFGKGAEELTLVPLVVVPFEYWCLNIHSIQTSAYWICSIPFQSKSNTSRCLILFSINLYVFMQNKKLFLYLLCLLDMENRYTYCLVTIHT